MGLTRAEPDEPLVQIMSHAESIHRTIILESPVLLTIGALSPTPSLTLTHTLSHTHLPTRQLTWGDPFKSSSSLDSRQLQFTRWSDQGGPKIQSQWTVRGEGVTPSGFGPNSSGLKEVLVEAPGLNVPVHRGPVFIRLLSPPPCAQQDCACLLLNLGQRCYGRIVHRTAHNLLSHFSWSSEL